MCWIATHGFLARGLLAWLLQATALDLVVAFIPRLRRGIVGSKTSMEVGTVLQEFDRLVAQYWTSMKPNSSDTDVSHTVAPPKLVVSSSLYKLGSSS